MRNLIGVGLAILLSSCASTTANYYTPTVQSWRGAQVAPLVQQWGQPDMRFPAPQGNTIYVYNTQGARASNGPSSPMMGVHFVQGGKPVMVTANTNSAISRGTAPVTCSAIFTVNPRGQIIGTEVQGRGCYGSQKFASRYGRI